jgi:hypothetical protein
MKFQRLSDFRDWTEIEAWAGSIAWALGALPTNDPTLPLRQ